MPEMANWELTRQIGLFCFTYKEFLVWGFCLFVFSSQDLRLEIVHKSPAFWLLLKKLEALGLPWWHSG